MHLKNEDAYPLGFECDYWVQIISRYTCLEISENHKIICAFGTIKKS